MPSVRLVAFTTGLLLLAGVLAAVTHEDDRGTNVQAGRRSGDAPASAAPADDPLTDLSLPDLPATSTTVGLPAPPVTATVPRVGSAPRRSTGPTTTTAAPAPKPTTATNCPGSAPAATATGLWLVDPSTGSLRRLLPTAVETYRWSPDGRRIAYMAREGGSEGGGGRIGVVDVASGRAAIVYDGQAGTPAWAPDGSTLAFALKWAEGKAGVATVPADGGEHRVLYETANVVGDVEVSARGLVGFTDGGRPFVMDLDGGNRRELAGGPANVHELVFSPDGTKVAYADGALVVQAVEGDDRVAFSSTESPGGPLRWATDGSRVLFRRVVGGAMRAAVARPDGSDFREVGLKGYGFSLSPTGNRLVWSSDHGAQARLVVTDLASGAERTVATGLWNSTWSPAGEDIATLGLVPDTTRNFVCILRGDTQRRVAELPGPPPYGTFEWSPSGSTLAFLTF